MIDYLRIAMERGDEEDEERAGEGLALPGAGTAEKMGNRWFGKAGEGGAPETAGRTGDGSFESPEVPAAFGAAEVSTGSGAAEGFGISEQFAGPGVAPVFEAAGAWGETERRRRSGRETVGAGDGDFAAGEVSAVSRSAAVSAIPAVSAVSTAPATAEVSAADRDRRGGGEGWALLKAVRRAGWESRFAEGQRRAFTVALPEGESRSGGWGMAELDRAVERDSRRYDSGFSMY